MKDTETIYPVFVPEDEKPIYINLLAVESFRALDASTIVIRMASGRELIDATTEEQFYQVLRDFYLEVL